jgi:hypothetical protein
LDFVEVRRFFLGVIGWTPPVLYTDASLSDLLLAFEGYWQEKGVFLQPRSLPDIAFMQDMIERHPDIKV